eukprot:CAMPEP_0194225120 /NCGR_PEP_ID=MMETSP0156-20130528/38825_1 /TAXON_ID=33649 /ORGANISM="Thalassionema nitzschioides, Strain L26-B" /LENGTH=949 /DNA_ID=CAMNT_0038956937 /DNA_START=362 /DNA_END=3211 /DNA_ORIENTATION=-
MIRITRKALNVTSSETLSSRDFKLALNYWTSIRGHSQLLKNSNNGGSPRYALDLVRVLSERGDCFFVREVIKSSDNAFGGVIYLLDHAFAEFLSESHQQHFDEEKANFRMVQKLLDILETISLLLRPLDNHSSTDVDYQILLVHLWSRRAWFLKRFLPSIKLTTDQINNIFEGAMTVEDCLFAMDEVARELLVTDSIDSQQLSKIYSLLIDSWVQSGLEQSENVAINYLKKMEQDARVTKIDSRPYNAMLTLCVQNKNDERAIYLWNCMRAPKSSVTPDYHTLGALLLTLVKTNRVDTAIKILRETEGEVTNVIPTNTACYNIILDGLSKGCYREADKEALSLLQTMMELSEGGENPQIAPDRITMSIIMDILASKGVPASEIEGVLVKCQSRAMTNPELEPDCIMYNIVLAAYAKESANRDQKSRSLDAPKRAKALLQTMTSNPKAQPNTTSYNSVLHAFVESEKTDLEQVLTLFEEMKTKAAEANGTIAPDTITYNIVLNALAGDTTEKGMERAEAFLEEFKINGIEADIITFNTLLNSMAKRWNPKISNRAEKILQKLEFDFKSGRSAVKPNVRSYNAVLNGYAKAGTVDACQRAEKLLKEMERLASDDANRADCRPDLVSYACMMDAYARSMVPDAGERAEKIIEYMEKASIEPNTICYNLAINCWAKSTHKDSPLRAESLLNRMQQRYESGNALSKPNSVSFTSVMNCWAQSRSDSSPERATEIMYKMDLLAKAGDKEMQPNAYTYSTIISAWGRSGRFDAVEKSLAIMNHVEENYSKKQSPLRANFAMYNATINAIAKSNSKSKARDAASLLERMKRDFHKGGNPHAAPTPTSFSAVINACAYTTNPEGREEAFQIARKTFRELLTKEYGEPTSACYINFLSVCSRLMPPGTERDQLAISTIFDCSERGLVNKKIMRSFKNAVSGECYKYAIVKCDLINIHEE